MSAAATVADGREPDSPTQLTKPSWTKILRRSVREFKADNVTDWAAALTYYGLLALFPGLLVIVSVLGLLGDSTVNSLKDNVDQIAPGGVKSFFDKVIQTVQGNAGAAGLTAIIGLVIALWSASSYIAAFMRAANAIYDVPEGRPVWKTIPTRVAVTVAAVIMLVASALIVVLSGSVASQVGQAIGVGDTAVTIWNIAKWPVLLVIVSLLLSMLYWACPNVKQAGFRWVSPGGVVAVVIWLVASAAFAVYVANFASYNKTYGTFAGVIIFLIWVWISNVAVLLGAEVNAELERERAIIAGVDDSVEPFVEPRDTRKFDDKQTEQIEKMLRQRDSASE